MSALRQYRDIATDSASAPDLSVAQWKAVRRQVPLLYAMLVANTVILAATHFGAAPIELTVYIPALLAFVCIARTAVWYRSRTDEVVLSKAQAGLRSMVWAGAALAIGFTAWSFSLYPYGDAYLHSQIAFYMSITTIGCMFCLMHVRTAALVVGVCVLVPFTAFFLMTGQETLVAIAINMVLVVTVLLVILLNNNKDFAALIASRANIIASQGDTLRLLDENHKLANLDSLTGVPNRRCFDRRLQERLSEAQQAGKSIAVARIDIDNFKSVNEIFGQITGDQVLIEIARRIEQVKRESTILARLEGGTFALIMLEPTDAAAQQRCADAIRGVFQHSFEMPLGTVRVTASMGIAASRPEDTADTLFDHADYATWVAKREARGGAVMFTDRHASELIKVRQMEQLLHSADLDSEIYILLQPQFDVSAGVTTGFEALARWRSPILGEVSPGEFIPMAERIGQICRITQIVLRKALEVSVTLPRGLRLSVNLSAHDIGSLAAMEQLVNVVKTYPRPCRLDFEITETAIMRDLRQANVSLLALLGLGARIALDDFGTGHSSLTHVQKLPLHRIKIDRSFVAEVTTDPASRAIIKTMIDLCRNLGISCVFEGIETEAQLEALVTLGGHVMQGYLFGRPMPVAMLDSYLANESSRRAVRNPQFSAAS
ncbi:putative bifunctional diguanylate cyclase/phosphodiesterase [Devosia rhizoryzae]|uniref:EAL domain-containing protein n=1 Tax=Devosia rhizoryzae TaxID=2774137 RepID=A0ABX7C2E9_9HYPH|nr:EAL domain-containing protein [Devosia rhizoryzae]QQR37922.1 EAL domain-containing protein [Devosia rhizoryzae]